MYCMRQNAGEEPGNEARTAGEEPGNEARTAGEEPGNEATAQHQSCPTALCTSRCAGVLDGWIVEYSSLCVT